MCTLHDFLSCKIRFIHTSTVTGSHSCSGKNYAYASRTFCSYSVYTLIRQPGEPGYHNINNNIGYSYNNELVVCKDSPDYLYNMERVM